MEEAGAAAAAAPPPAAVNDDGAVIDEAAADEGEKEEEEEKVQAAPAALEEERAAATMNLDNATAAAAAAAPTSSAPPSSTTAETTSLSAAQRLSLVVLWDAEAAQLAAAFSARPPLTPWPRLEAAPLPPPRRLASQGAPTPLELAPFLVDRGDPLSELSARVCAALGGETSAATLSEAGTEGGDASTAAPAAAAAAALLSVDVVKSEILALAKRSLVGCSSLAEAEVAASRRLAGGNSLEDAAPGRLWHWELREPRRAPAKFRADRKSVV